MVHLTGAWGSAYVSDETPMVQYINTHYALEERRKYAEQARADGPRVRSHNQPFHRHGLACVCGLTRGILSFM